ncbi:MAG: response regulator [Candidatus Dactylopiibacterium sp.]|nr:response regulator [Candidatus Dactylopiibacterium sp.]
MPEISLRLNVSIDRSRHTVLVVDDNPATRYATARSLRAAGFKTLEAGTGHEALELSSGNVSAVILDIHLPDIDGLEVCRLIRARETTTALPIIHLSAAFIREADKVAGLEAGADAYLVHPAEPAMLIATVQALVRARLAEESVRRSEMKFRSIYNEAQCGIALVDPAGHVQDANPAFLEMLGLTHAQIVGRAVAELAAPASAERVARCTAASGQENATWNEQFVFLDKDGGEVHVEWNMSTTVENDLRVAVINNVSERIQLEAARKHLLEREQAARAAAERHSRTQDDFVAVLSHELRNPLSAITLNAHLLLRRNPPPEYVRSLDAIKRNANTQARIISDILDVSRINSGKLTLEREWADAAEVVSNSLDSMRDQIEQKHLKLLVDLATQGRHSFIDSARYQQVFWNLLSNAVKFSEEGGEIHVTLAMHDGQLRLVIRDTGKGIDEAFLPRIFDKFTQSEAPRSRKQGGLGLGMSIVRQLVELHGGTVKVESPGVGLGTRVTVDIPQAERSQDAAPAVAAKPRGARTADNLENTRILVVEDDQEAAAILVLILQDRGASVELANDYASALKLLARSRPDVLISDIGLPGKDGYDLIRTVRAEHEADGHIPAIALTAFGRESDRDQALVAGFDIHLSKPMTPQKMLDTLVDLLDKYRG